MPENPLLDNPLPQYRSQRRNWGQIVFLGLELVLWILIFAGMGLRRVSSPGFYDLGIGLSDTALGGLKITYMLFPAFILGSRGWVRHLGSYAVGFALSTAVNNVQPLFGIINFWSIDRVIGGDLLGLALIVMVLVLLKQNPARWHQDNFYKHVVVRLAFFAVSLLYSLVLYFFLR